VHSLHCFQQVLHVLPFGWHVALNQSA
jgi:hypothetical protein